MAAEAVRSLPHDVSITIAGRSTAKLNALVQQLNAGDRLKVCGCCVQGVGAMGCVGGVPG